MTGSPENTIKTISTQETQETQAIRRSSFISSYTLKLILGDQTFQLSAGGDDHLLDVEDFLRSQK